MKIVFLNTLYHPCAIGGAQMCVQELAERLVGDDHHVTVFATSETNDIQRYTHMGVDVVKLPLANVYNPYGGGAFKSHPRHKRAVWHLRDRFNTTMQQRLLAETAFRDADVISANVPAGFSVASWRAAIQAKVPLVVTLHDYYALCGRSAMYKPKTRQVCATQCGNCRVMRMPARKLSHQAAAVIGVSQSMLQKHLTQGYFENVPAYAIHNGISPLPIPTRPRTGPVRQIAYLGSIIPEKGVDLAIQAFTALNDPTLELHIFGNGPEVYCDALKAMDTTGRVVWRGVTPAAQALAESDVLVVPSLWDEPFGRVAVEGLSAGLAVVGARRGGITEILNGCAAGRLFDPAHRQDFTTALRTLADLPADAFDALRGVARSKAAEFTQDIWYAKHLKVLEDVCKNQTVNAAAQ